MSIEKNKPNFEEFRKVLLLEEKPQYVPVAELLISQEVKEAYLGKSIPDIKTEIEFWAKAGYDYVRFFPNYFFPKKHYFFFLVFQDLFATSSYLK